MEYKVVLTSVAKIQFRHIIDYLLYELDDKILRAKGYRTIHFKKHQYIMVYTIDGNVVYVEGIYHDLQDYENTLR